MRACSACEVTIDSCVYVRKWSLCFETYPPRLTYFDAAHQPLLQFLTNVTDPLNAGPDGVCSKTCLATVLIRSIFAREKMHERFSASAVFPAQNRTN